VPSKHKLHFGIELDPRNRVYRHTIVIAQRNEALGKFIVMQGMTSRVLKIDLRHSLILMVDKQILLLFDSDHRYADCFHMVDLTDIVDKGGLLAHNVMGDSLFLQIPEVDCVFVIGYPLIRLLEVHDLLAAVAG